MTRLAVLVAQHKSTSRLLMLGSLSLQSPAVMGILNITPDSFSDGGKLNSVEAACAEALSMAAAGASLLDIGGESTRPGALDVSLAEELQRVIPVIEAVKKVVDLPISIDTSKPEVMREAVAAGALMINDVMALQAPGALQEAARLNVPVCLMHMQGKPRTMQNSPIYADVAVDVTAFLSERVAQCVQAGIRREQIIVDPGFGFGKALAHNVELLANLRTLQQLGLPVLVGLSRKRSLGDLTGKGVDGRLPASLSAATIAVLNGAAIVRAHDVGETVDALRIVSAVMEAAI
jgi:dihydropteroate synthase